MLNRVKIVLIIIFLNWLVLIFLFYTVSSIIVPLEIRNGLPDVFLTGLLKVFISGLLFTLWLYIWNLCVKTYFVRKCLKQ